jgi:hypothetical protein
MIDWFNESQTILGLVGVIIGCSSWLVKKAFDSHNELMLTKLENLEGFMSNASFDINDSKNRLHSIEKDLAVSKTETSGMFIRIEEILKMIRLESAKSMDRIESLEAHAFVRAKAVNKKRKKDHV